MNKIKVFGKVCASLLLFGIPLTASPAHSQNYLKKLGSGLSNPVTCSCVDSLGNVYAVTSGWLYSSVVNKWDVTNKTWSVYASLNQFRTYNQGTCNILNGKLYVFGQDSVSGAARLMEYSGTWKTAAVFRMSTWNVPVSSVKFKNRLYFAGGFDSVNLQRFPNVVVYDGSTFSDASFPAAYRSNGWFQSAFEIVSDTLYMTAGNRIIRHTSPSTWSSYAVSSDGRSFNSIAFNNGSIYSSVDNAIILFKDGVKRDSFTVPKAYYMLELMSFKGRLFIKDRGITQAGASNLFSLQSGRDIKYIFNIQLGDSVRFSFLKNANSLFYHGYFRTKVNNIDYSNIVEILVDSLHPVGFDTIRGRVFWDKNRDNKLNSGDVLPYSGYMRNLNSGDYVAFGNSGFFEEIIADTANSDYGLYIANFDSCVRFGFSGNIRTHNTDPGVTIDTIDCPVIKPFKGNWNLVLRSINNPMARLNDSIPVTISIRSEDCYLKNTVNANVSVTLDPNTVLAKSVPAFSSRSGNIYYYNNLTLDHTKDNQIKLYLIYPNTSYKLGQAVKHMVQLGNIPGEDPIDNKDSIVQRLVYSYDPNSKHSVPEGKITSELTNVRYYIDFQNLGNAPAYRVTVVDTLNLNIPVYEFKMVGASHPYSVTITPGTNVVTWVFDNINLAAKDLNEKASKGYIVFDARLMRNVRVGDSIRNRAYIYFDYNVPVITNYAVVNRVDKIYGIRKIYEAAGSSMKLYPNPVSEEMVVMNLNANATGMRVYDACGRLVTTFNVEGFSEAGVNAGDWAPGIYSVISDRGEVLKFIVE